MLSKYNRSRRQDRKSRVPASLVRQPTTIRVRQDLPYPIVSTKMITRWVRYQPTVASTTSGGAVFISVTALASMAGWFGSSATSYLYNCDSIQMKKARVWALSNTAPMYGGASTFSFEFVGPNMHETKHTLATGTNQANTFMKIRPPKDGAASWPYNLQDYVNVDIYRITWSAGTSFVLDFKVSYVEMESVGVQQSSVTSALPGRSYPYLDTLTTLATYTTPGLIQIGEGLPISTS